MTDNPENNFLEQARIFYEAMGTPLEDFADLDLPALPDPHAEIGITLSRVEIEALLPLVCAAQMRAEIDDDVWGMDQQQWWAVTRSRLTSALRQLASEG